MTTDNREDVTFSTLKFAIRHMINNELLSDCKVYDTQLESIMRDETWFQIVVFLQSELLEEITVRHPADWWQSFKEHWFPGWILKLYPVHYHTIHIQASAFNHKVHEVLQQKGWAPALIMRDQYDPPISSEEYTDDD